MSNLYTFLAGFDPYNDDEYTWENNDAEDARTAQLLAGDLSIDKDATLKLDMSQRQALDARIAGAIDVTQHDEFWCQTCGTGYYEAGRCVYCGADEPLPFA